MLSVPWMHNRINQNLRQVPSTLVQSINCFGKTNKKVFIQNIKKRCNSSRQYIKILSHKDCGLGNNTLIDSNLLEGVRHVQICITTMRYQLYQQWSSVPQVPIGKVSRPHHTSHYIVQYHPIRVLWHVVR